MPYRQSTDTYIGKRKDAISSVLFCIYSSHSVRKYTGITDEPLLCCCLIRKNARITDELLLFDLLVRKQAGITDGQIAAATKSAMSRLHVPRGRESRRFHKTIATKYKFRTSGRLRGYCIVRLGRAISTSMPIITNTTNISGREKARRVVFCLIVNVLFSVD